MPNVLDPANLTAERKTVPTPKTPATQPSDTRTTDPFSATDVFVDRHIGPRDAEIAAMLKLLGVTSMDALMDQTVPGDIRLKAPIRLPAPLSEFEALKDLRAIASKNKVSRSMIGMGYYDTITPPVIQRNILENPGWYTQYTPYQAEISQGRLEALINFQTMVADLSGLPLANASLLDEATAAAEAMHMCMAIRADEFEAGRRAFFVATDCHPQTINVVKTRARPLGVEVVVGDPVAQFSNAPKSQSGGFFGILLQYPNTYGTIHDYSTIVDNAHSGGALVVVATDLLALTLIKPPGEWGADIAVGSAQRFGVPLGGGGPHAAFMATRDEYARQMPGRIIGVSKDVHGKPGYRLAIQTREQHIRREKATSNICTAQVLLAIMASMYAVYHGPKGLRRIAERVHKMTRLLDRVLECTDYEIAERHYFDTIRLNHVAGAQETHAAIARLQQVGVNARENGDGTLCLSFDETTTLKDLDSVFYALCPRADASWAWDRDLQVLRIDFPNSTIHTRQSPYLTHPVFNTYHSEHEMLRYIKRLEARDLSLTTSMIPLGSCTMKLNAAAEMFPVSWPEFSKMHPYAPAEQQAGYAEMCGQLEKWLAGMTGFAAVSLQPNSGAQGEYAGLLAIRAYHEANAGGMAAALGGHACPSAKTGSAGASPSQAPSLTPQSIRDICLIPVSAHGTNPASAVMAGFCVVAVKCDANGNVDIPDLRAKAAEHADRLGALMITYPSTHGVFEEGAREICKIVHEHGGLVYMDGANLNAQLGLTSPGEIGADVCHLNLHKTFCIPHGGGGPGMGPIAVAKHLAPFLPSHPLNRASHSEQNTECGVRNAESKAGNPRGASVESDIPNSEFRIPNSVGPVSAAPYGSASILTISWMYIRMMGEPGLRKATQVAILNANYIAARLTGHYKVLYTGKQGRCAHECIVDCRPFEQSAGVKVEDIAKRLMDYGFHAPTMSFPVPGTLMIEPTESESQAELDRLCDALIAIRGEIRAIEEGRLDRADNPLKHAPHTAAAVTATEWPHKYSREQAAYPAAWLREHKFWPPVGRIDNVWGDRNLFCTCVPLEDSAT